MNLVLIFLVTGFFCFFGLIFFIFIHLSQGWSFKHLLKDFKRKIWMTICLGFIFLMIYVLFVILSSYFAQQWRTDLLFLVYRNPIPYIYDGLWLFACFSLGIYLARMIIKYFYLTRGKDN